MATTLAVAEQHGPWWFLRLPSGLVTQARSVPELQERADDLGGLDDAEAATRAIVLPVQVRGAGRQPRPRRFLYLPSGHEVTAALQQLGFLVAERTGSHVLLAGPDARRVGVPLDHEVSAPALEAILRQAGVSVDELEAYL